MSERIRSIERAGIWSGLHCPKCGGEVLVKAEIVLGFDTRRFRWFVACIEKLYDQDLLICARCKFAFEIEGVEIPVDTIDLCQECAYAKKEAKDSEEHDSAFWDVYDWGEEEMEA